MRSSFLYGAISSIVLIIFKLAVYFLHLQLTPTGIITGIVSIGLTFLPIYVASKNRRDYELNGYISMRQVMRVGFGISLVAGIIFGVFIYLYYQFIDHETVTMVLERIEGQLREAKATQSQIDLELVSQRDFYSPFNQALKGGLLSIIGSGFVLSFIASTFLVRKQEDNQINS